MVRVEWLSEGSFTILDVNNYADKICNIEHCTIGQNLDLLNILHNSFSYSTDIVIVVCDKKILGLLPVAIISGTLVSIPHFSYGDFICPSFSYGRCFDAFTVFCENKGLNYEIRSLVKSDKYIESDKVSAFLQLKPTATDQFSNFHKKLRSQIKKGYKNGVTVKVCGIESLSDFYYVYSHNMHKLGSPPLPLVFFIDLFKGYKKGSILIFIAMYENKPIGCSLVLEYKGFSEVCWASTLHQYNRLSANMVLYWGMIENSIECNGSIFSFGRASYGGGPYNFKKQWGVSMQPLYWKKSYMKDIQIKNIKILSTVWKRLPYRLTISLSKIISKYIY